MYVYAVQLYNACTCKHVCVYTMPECMKRVCCVSVYDVCVLECGFKCICVCSGSCVCVKVKLTHGSSGDTHPTFGHRVSYWNLGLIY